MAEMAILEKERSCVSVIPASTMTKNTFLEKELSTLAGAIVIVPDVYEPALVFLVNPSFDGRYEGDSCDSMEESVPESNFTTKTCNSNANVMSLPALSTKGKQIKDTRTHTDYIYLLVNKNPRSEQLRQEGCFVVFSLVSHTVLTWEPKHDLSFSSARFQIPFRCYTSLHSCLVCDLPVVGYHGIPRQPRRQDLVIISNLFPPCPGKSN
ncbi:hypothetical protein BHE90_001311 [Fusarium euwallaceae]|uniref:Uncharacterized protein n=2 Tax=Fusarium solani species complex TaxID=232080 RepID=A0A430M8C2_9HYPO|nr:hypothetical protein CEP51_006316 [Fusarium floridanum]RTE84236.1 hypothetical protein BHE90_001311 [Fusarium euwallaceae]